jgi:hypothetical protein
MERLGERRHTSRLGGAVPLDVRPPAPAQREHRGAGAAGLSFSSAVGLAARVAIFVAGTLLRVHFEERLLRKRFGPALERYAEAVPAFFPRIGTRRKRRETVKDERRGDRRRRAEGPAPGGAAGPTASFLRSRLDSLEGRGDRQHDEAGGE